MSNSSNDRFDVLMDLAEKIADNNKPKSLVILRPKAGKWLVTLHTLPVTEDTQLEFQDSASSDRLEAALEKFVLNPRK